LKIGNCRVEIRQLSGTFDTFSAGVKVQMKVLVINGGSSSIKSSLFDSNQLDKHDQPPLWKGQVNFRGDNTAELITHSDNSPESKSEFPAPNTDAGFRKLFEAITGNGSNPVVNMDEIKVVGHRVVHGGDKYFSATQVDDQLISDLKGFIELAPAHEQANINGIQAAREHFGQIPEVAVFDTAFHHSMPLSSVVYGGPYSWFETDGIRRYGFHGISHQYCAQRAAELIGKDLNQLRIINCHLGNGGSLCAIKHGASVMTTMGYTPLEGLVMGTRSGSIDPGIIIHFIQHKKYSAEALLKVLNKESGLKGISGISGDMRDIQTAAKDGNQRAKLAFDIYVQSVSTNICALLPRLSGVDVLIFAGGIGENSPDVRSAVCAQLDFLGVKIDVALNQSTVRDCDISDKQSDIRTFVIHTNEELAIARECLKFCSE
jgi:acetate kinase